MCSVKTPTPQKDPNDDKKPQYMANPWLDGLGIAGSRSRGRNSLRIDPGTPRAPVNTNPPPATPPPTTPPPRRPPPGGTYNGGFRPGDGGFGIRTVQR